MLGWAEQHPLASVRSHAARIRRDFADLTERRTNELAVDQAADEVARITAELAQAKNKLKALKHGTAPTATAAKPTGAQRSKEENTAIRTWAREHGYQVGTGGIIKQEIIDAFEAARPTTTLAEAS
ncbi:histone-like nucleoid-structuring protein Lsr2 [Streptomyces sp. NPDC006530]|uniref:Lsr2 family DNA-binding protein n=1 Tax=Streptomyces sp. NPDC006530 TaxID=3364750 RepID=UPI0036A48531